MSTVKVDVPATERRLRIEDLNDDAVFKLCIFLVKSAKYDFYRTYYLYRMLLEERNEKTSQRVTYPNELKQARDAFYGSLRFFESDLFESMIKSEMSGDEYIRYLVNHAKEMFDKDPNNYLVTMHSYKGDYV